MADTAQRKNTGLIALGAVAVAGLLVAILSIGLAISQPAPLRPAPQDREVRLVIAALEPHDPMMAMEEKHLYFPGTIFANVGDRIILTIMNMDEHRHGFEIHALNVETDATLDIMPGDEVTISFVVNQAGTFEFECNVPYVAPTPPATEHTECGEDHDEMKGYLIVQ